MATGTDAYKGLAVPLFGDFNIKQRTAGTDMMTLTGITAQTGDFIVCEDSAGNENFVVEEEGQVTIGSACSIGAALTVVAGGVGVTAGDIHATAGDVIVADGYYFRYSSPVTTAPTTGLTKGDFFIAMSTSTPQIGICYSTAGKSLRYITADTKTIGRTTA